MTRRIGSPPTPAKAMPAKEWGEMVQEIADLGKAARLHGRWLEDGHMTVQRIRRHRWLAESPWWDKGKLYEDLREFGVMHRRRQIGRVEVIDSAFPGTVCWVRGMSEPVLSPTEEAERQGAISRRNYLEEEARQPRESKQAAEERGMAIRDELERKEDIAQYGHGGYYSFDSRRARLRAQADRRRRWVG